MHRSQIKTNYRVRYRKVMDDLNKISHMYPQDIYMHRLMDSVIFQDFETALNVVIENFSEADNDNKEGARPH